MGKYNFIVRKIQEAVVEVDVDKEETIGDIAEKIEKMKESELEFDQPTYILAAITREKSKISEIIWKHSRF